MTLQPRNEAMELALKALADYDIKNAPLLQAGEQDEDRADTTSIGSRFFATW